MRRQHFRHERLELLHHRVADLAAASPSPAPSAATRAGPSPRRQSRRGRPPRPSFLRASWSDLHGVLLRSRADVLPFVRSGNSSIGNSKSSARPSARRAFDERLDVERVPPLDARQRARVAGNRGVNSVQQSSSGMIEISIGAEPLRLERDLFLVEPDQRPQHRQRRDAADRRQVVDRLRRDLADDVAGDERLRAGRAARAARRCASSGGGRRRPGAAAAPTTTTCCWMSPNGTRRAASAAGSRVSSRTSSRALSCDARDRIG